MIEFTSKVVNLREGGQNPMFTIFDSMYPLQLPFRVIKKSDIGIPLAGLVDRLAFIRNKQRWAGHLRNVVLRPLSRPDFIILSDAIPSYPPKR